MHASHDHGVENVSSASGNENARTNLHLNAMHSNAPGLDTPPNAHFSSEFANDQSIDPYELALSPVFANQDRSNGNNNQSRDQRICDHTRASVDMSVVLPSVVDAQQQPFDPTIFYTPTHLPTILIEYWFSDVCPMWSIFDSDANFNRRFASMTWASSEPVFYAMQSMSAACLVDTMPTVMPVLSSLTSKTLAAIKGQVSVFPTRQSVDSRFPADLLFAIFAMGTSLHWKFGYELGGSLIKDASLIIGHYKCKLPSLNACDREQLAFFQKALICWEGLLSAADRNFTPATFAIRRRAYHARITTGQDQPYSQQRIMGPPALTLSDEELHPWCGVSSDVLQKFGQVLSLCHLARRRRGNSSANTKIEMECDTGLARELAMELAVMDFNRSPWHSGPSPATKDDDTPLSHLLGVAEAYRQSCFLQLCLTFEEIAFDSQAYPGLGLAVPYGEDAYNVLEMTRVQGLVGLSLKLVEQLKQIPPESGSRCMQPVLYLCAASGLQVASAMSQDPYASLFEQSTASYKAHGGQSAARSDDHGTSRHSTENSDRAHDLNNDTMLTVSALKVAQARTFVKRRLGMLQQLLPPRYVGTALRLAEAIWAEYDCTEGGGSPLYWFDVMVREKLQTFFG